MKTRANPSVETVTGTGTASEGSANRIVMVLGRPVGWPLRVNLETPSVRVCREALGAVRGGTGGLAGIAGRLPVGFCRVPAGFQQALNGQSRGRPAGALVLI